MAIGKWISFGTAQPVSNPPVAVVAPPHIVSAADAKQFGLENVRRFCRCYLLICLSVVSLEIHGVHRSVIVMICRACKLCFV